MMSIARPDSVFSNWIPRWSSPAVPRVPFFWPQDPHNGATEAQRYACEAALKLQYMVNRFKIVARLTLGLDVSNHPDARLYRLRIGRGVALLALSVLFALGSLAAFWRVARPALIADPVIDPARLAIYYGWPSLVNGAAGDLRAATSAFAEFDLVVLGDGLEHPGHGDHWNTGTIIGNLIGLGTEVYGYIDLGVTTQNLDLATINSYVDEWAAMGVSGIFFDDAGQDFGVDRARLRSAVEYVHSAGLKVFVNAWDPADVLAEDPPGTPTPLQAGDWYLAESHPVWNGQFSDLDSWWSKSQALLSYRAQTGVQIAAVSTGDLSSTGWPNQPYFRQALWGAYQFGFDAFGFTDPQYSASGAGANLLEPLPPLVTDPGISFNGPVTGPITSTLTGGLPTYVRSTDRGEIYVFGDTSSGGGIFRGGDCDTTLLGDNIWPTCSVVPPPQSSTFGPRQKASSGLRFDWHRGVDIPQPLGDPVYAVRDGMVRIPGNEPGYSDLLVQLRHGENAPYLYSNYMHLYTVTVAVGGSIHFL